MEELERLLASLTDPNIQPDGWVRINEFSDLLSSLKTLEKLLELAVYDIGTWKWVILCLHNSLQATAVCLLTRSDGFGARPERDEQRINAFYHANKNTFNDADEFQDIADREQVAPLPVLLRRLGYNFPEKEAQKPAKEADEEMYYLVKLHDWRSRFAHFPPTQWSAPEQEFVEMTRITFSIICRELRSSKWQRAPLITEDELLPLLNAIEHRLNWRLSRRFWANPKLGNARARACFNMLHQMDFSLAGALRPGHALARPSNRRFAFGKTRRAHALSLGRGEPDKMQHAIEPHLERMTRKYQTRFCSSSVN